MARNLILLTWLMLLQTFATAETVIFQDTFEKDEVGKPPAMQQGDTGGSWSVDGNVAVEAARDGNRCLRGRRETGLTGTQAMLSNASVASLKGKVLLVRFEIFKPSSDDGPAAVAAFNGPVGNDTRTFQVQFQYDGSIARVVGSDFVDVDGISLELDAWQHVTLIADFGTHTFDVDIEGSSIKGLPFVTKQGTIDRVFFGPNGNSVNVFFDDVVMVVDPGPELLAAALPSKRHEAPRVPKPPRSRRGPIYDAADRAQLFVDQVLVRRYERVWFTQHQGVKHPKNPVLKADQPWEGWRNYVYGDVIYDEQEKLFKMWYITVGDYKDNMEYFDDLAVTCYATSPDGINWTKPLVGTLPSKNGKPHNAMGYIHMASVIKDLKDPDAQRRYKMIAWSHRPRGYHSFISLDGIKWARLSDKPISSGGDVITGFWDPSRNLYVAFPKIGTSVRGFNRRVFWTITSEDFIRWTEPVLSWTVDLRDDVGSLARLEQVRPILDRKDNLGLMRTEYYGIGAYAHESCTIAFPWVFTINNNARWGNQDGCQEIQLGVSRDLINWERPFRTPIIDIGQIDQWDASYHTTAAHAIRVGDEIWLYYGGANYTHGSPCLYKAKDSQTGEDFGRKTRYTASVGLVTWKLDRFVSADGSAEGGTLTTIPFRFEGDRLEINARTNPGGSIVVELLSAAEQPIEAFSPSAPFTGDELRHGVKFGGSRPIRDLVGKPVMLRFHLKSAQLFGFAFKSTTK